MLSIIPVLAVLVLAALWVAAPARAQQSASAAVEQAAQRAFHGADLQGKDGPMAKLDPVLIQLYYRYQHGGAGAVRSQSNPAVQNRTVVIDALASSDASALRADLEALGLESGATAGPLVSGRLPIARLETAAALASLRSARPSYATTRVGQTTSQGVRAMRADEARQQYNVDGSGITVGVLSDSYNQDENEETNATEDMTNNDLPSQVAVLDDSETTGSDEGRAMMQLIYDVAPGTDFTFHTAFGGRANFAQGIRELAGAGAGVIVDDVINLAEPMFQDGQVAQAVNDVVQNSDVAYFSSAGNSADQSYESAFRNSGQSGPLAGGGPLHDFDSGSATDVMQTVSLAQSNTLKFDFQWDQPYASSSASSPGSASDLDIFIADMNGNVLESSTFDNNGNDGSSADNSDPFEILTFENNGSTDADNDGSPDTQFQFGIQLKSGPEPGLMKYVQFGNATIEEYDTNSSTLFGHANADGAEAVGAAFYGDTPEFNTDPPELESFSAEGGTPILFDVDGNRLSSREVRRKPELVAPDGTNNTFFGGDVDGDGFPNFFGTSAAAPHAAGVAALVREGRPALAPQEIYANMEETAIDMNNPYNSNASATEPTICSSKFDFGTGCGLVDALAVGQSGSLPVELAGDFSGVSEAGDVVLTWTTLSETNNDHFRILQQQGDAFVEVGAEPSQVPDGTTNAAQQYRHRVEGVAPGRHTFRLVQVDRDATERFGVETTVEVGIDGPFHLSEVYPNPVRGQARLDLTVAAPQHVTATLFDARGRRVRTLYDARLEGERRERLAVEAGALASGVYVVRVTGETFSETRTLTLVR